MGKINLNSIVYAEKITKDDLLNVISQEDVFAFYMGLPHVVKGRYNSPFREDNNPSFSLWYNQQGTFMFKDHGNGFSGDCIRFVGLLLGLEYYQALWRIAYDFNFSTRYEAITSRVPKKKIIQKPITIGIKRRKWRGKDAAFWKSFGIRKATLKRYNVVPIEYLFVNDAVIQTKDVTYAYLETKDNIVSYKIYQPYNTKGRKWTTNTNYTVHQGYRQLPPEGETLIITKSLKDVMSLYDVTGYPSIGLQSENVTIKQTVLDEYKRRFRNIVCLFDNDKRGREFTETFCGQCNLPYIFMPEIEGVTDFSDLVKVRGIEEAKTIFKTIIDEIKQ